MVLADSLTMDARQSARSLAVARIAIGGALMLAPKRLGRVWLGAPAQQSATATVVRCLGARDIALGVGLARAIESGGDPRPWVLAAGAADACDAIATAAAWRELPATGRALVTAMATTAAVAALRLSGRLRA